MSHFLGRLVERARGTAPRVEPIIAPRFAPAPYLRLRTRSRRLRRKILNRLRPLLPPVEPRGRATAPPRNRTARMTQRSGSSRKTPLVPQVREEAPPFVVSANAILSTKSRLRAEPIGRQPGRSLATAPGRISCPSRTRDEAPIVRVTIGRIEVRAAPAPAPTAAKNGSSVSAETHPRRLLKSRKESAR